MEAVPVSDLSSFFPSSLLLVVQKHLHFSPGCLENSLKS